MALKIGDQAPDFDVVGSVGGEQRQLRLLDFRGKKNVVLYFYPRDFTPVCTRETCGFRDLYAELVSRDTEVIGVSVDDEQSHARFAKEHGLIFPLVSDPERKLVQSYQATSFLSGLLGATKRITYVIDKQGKIAAILDSQIRADQHVQGAKAAIAKLG